MLQLLHTKSRMLKNYKILKRGIYRDLLTRKASMAVIGMNNAGWNLAREFSKDFEVIGFDNNEERIGLMQNGIDPFNIQPMEAVANVKVTNNYNDLKKARFYVIAVDSVLDDQYKPNLQALVKATHSVAKVLKKRDFVVFEATSYPGCIEEVCIPLLEEMSGLVMNKDFKVGFSPEQFKAPGRFKKLNNIEKLVAGGDNSAVNQISDVYNHIIKGGVHKSPTIRLTEILKIIDYTQSYLHRNRLNYA